MLGTKGQQGSASPPPPPPKQGNPTYGGSGTFTPLTQAQQQALVGNSVAPPRSASSSSSVYGSASGGGGFAGSSSGSASQSSGLAQVNSVPNNAIHVGTASEANAVYYSPSGEANYYVIPPETPHFSINGQVFSGQGAIAYAQQQGLPQSVLAQNPELTHQLNTYSAFASGQPYSFALQQAGEAPATIQGNLLNVSLPQGVSQSLDTGKFYMQSGTDAQGNPINVEVQPQIAYEPFAGTEQAGITTPSQTITINGQKAEVKPVQVKAGENIPGTNQYASQAGTYITYSPANPLTPFSAQAGWYLVNGKYQYVSNPAYLGAVASSGGTIGTSPITGISYDAGLAKLSSSDSNVAIIVNPPQSLTPQTNLMADYYNPNPTPPSITPKEGVIAANIASDVGSAGADLTPASIIGLSQAGLSPTDIREGVQNLSKADIEAINNGNPYLIYYKTSVPTTTKNHDGSTSTTTQQELGTIYQGQFTPLSQNVAAQLSFLQSLRSSQPGAPSGSSYQTLSPSTIGSQVQLPLQMQGMQPTLARQTNLSLQNLLLPTTNNALSNIYNLPQKVGGYLNNNVALPAENFINTQLITPGLRQSYHGFYNALINPQTSVPVDSAANLANNLYQDFYLGSQNINAAINPAFTTNPQAQKLYQEYIATENPYVINPSTYNSNNTIASQILPGMQAYLNNQNNPFGLRVGGNFLYTLVEPPLALTQPAPANPTFGTELTGLENVGSTALDFVPVGALASKGVAVIPRLAMAGATGAGVNTLFNVGGDILTGQPLNLAQSLGQGAAFGVQTEPLFAYLNALVSPYAKLAYARLTGKATAAQIPVLDYIAKYGSNPTTDDFLNTINYLGADASKAYVFSDSAGNLLKNNVGKPLLYYGNVNMGYQTAGQIKSYLAKVAANMAKKGEEPNFNLATTSGENLGKNLVVQSQTEGAESRLGGVRGRAYAPAEGMYFNLPSLQGNPIQLNYGGVFGEGSYTEPKLKLSLNPFAPQGTALTSEVNLANVNIPTLRAFIADTGLNPFTPQGQTALSKWLSEQAEAKGAQFYAPYQNYNPTTAEAQLMARIGTPIKSIGQKVAIVKTSQPGELLKASIVKLANAQNLAEFEDEVAQLPAQEQAAVQKAYQQALAESSQPSEIVSPLSASPLEGRAVSTFLSSLKSSSPSAYSKLFSPSLSVSSLRSVSSPLESPSPSRSASESLSRSASPSSSSSRSSVSRSVSPSRSSSSSSSSSSSGSSSSSFSSSGSESSSGSSSFSGSSSSYKKPQLPSLSLNEIQSAEPVQAQDIYDTYRSLYSPSLLPLLFPELEAKAEASYNPLTAAAGLRPLKAPTATTPITLAEAPQSIQRPSTMEIGQVAGITNPTTTQSSPALQAVALPQSQFANTAAFSPYGTYIPDPTSIVLAQTLQDRLASESPLILPNGVSPSSINNPFLNGGQGNFNTALQNVRNQINSKDYTTSQIENPGLSLVNGREAGQPGFGRVSISPSSPNAMEGRLLLPTGQQLASIMGYQPLLRLLNQIDPIRFSVYALQYGSPSALLSSVNNLGYDDIAAIFGRLTPMQRAQAYLATGAAMSLGQALEMANGYSASIPPFANSGINQIKRKEAISQISAKAYNPAFAKVKA